MTSAVTRTPAAFAARSTPIVCADDTWQTCSRAPASRASAQSRATIVSSAVAGHPASPSCAATTPSWACAPAVSRWSSACWAITASSDDAYSRARRITTGSCTQRPSSENTRTRARDAAMVPSSAIRSPPSPTVTAPTGWTSTSPASSPSRRTCSTTTAESATGSVLGIAKTAV